MWEDFKDIKIAVGETLSQFARRDDLIGWVRPSQEANMPALADEIARLSKENAELRSQMAKSGSEDTINGLSFHELSAILEDKGLLSFLDQHRPLLGSAYGIRESTGSAHISELCLLGLLKLNPRGPSGHYELTDGGHVFLNRLEAQKRPFQAGG